MDPLGDAELNALGRRLHQSLLQGDPTASAQIAEAFLPRVVEKLERAFSNLYDAHLIEGAADDAIISYLERPAQYNPEKLPLDRYLVMSARGDLLNLLRNNSNQGLPDSVDLVELDGLAPEHEMEVADPSVGPAKRAEILGSPVWPLIQQLLTEPGDLEVALLMLEGVRDTREFGKALGLNHLTAVEQETEVKKNKDRIKKRLRRHIDRSQLDLER